MKKVFTIMVLVALTTIMGCGGGRYARINPSTTGAIAQESGTISGNAQQVKPLTLNKGAVIFTMEVNQSNSNFIVWLKNANGENVDLLLNEIVSQGTFSAMVSAPYDGRYFLDVDTGPDSGWIITYR